MNPKPLFLSKLLMFSRFHYNLLLTHFSITKRTNNVSDNGSIDG